MKEDEQEQSTRTEVVKEFMETEEALTQVNIVDCPPPLVAAELQVSTSPSLKQQRCSVSQPWICSACTKEEEARRALEKLGHGTDLTSQAKSTCKMFSTQLNDPGPFLFAFYNVWACEPIFGSDLIRPKTHILRRDGAPVSGLALLPSPFPWCETQLRSVYLLKQNCRPLEGVFRQAVLKEGVDSWLQEGFAISLGPWVTTVGAINKRYLADTPRNGGIGLGVNLDGGWMRKGELLMMNGESAKWVSDVFVNKLVDTAATIKMLGCDGKREARVKKVAPSWKNY